MLESFVYFNDKIKSIAKKHEHIYVYGFDESSRELLLLLAKNEIYVNGFIVDDKDYTFIGQSFLNKEVYNFGKLRADDLLINYIGYSKNLPEPCDCRIEPALLCKKIVGNVYIYGCGKWGERAYRCLRDLNIPVTGFFDNAVNKHNTTYCGLPVMVYNANENECEQTIIIAISIHNYEAIANISKKFKKSVVTYIFNGIYSLEPSSDIENYRRAINLVESKDSVAIKFNHLDIFGCAYYNRIGKDIILYGEYNHVCMVAEFLSCFDISIKYGIDCKHSVIHPRDSIIEFCDEYDLLYEDASVVRVLII